MYMDRAFLAIDSYTSLVVAHFVQVTCADDSELWRNATQRTHHPSADFSTWCRVKHRSPLFSRIAWFGWFVISEYVAFGWWVRSARLQYCALSNSKLASCFRDGRVPCQIFRRSWSTSHRLWASRSIVFSQRAGMAVQNILPGCNIFQVVETIVWLFTVHVMDLPCLLTGWRPIKSDRNNTMDKPLSSLNEGKSISRWMKTTITHGSKGTAHPSKGTHAPCLAAILYSSRGEASKHPGQKAMQVYSKHEIVILVRPLLLWASQSQTPFSEQLDEPLPQEGTNPFNTVYICPSSQWTWTINQKDRFKEKSNKQ